MRSKEKRVPSMGEALIRNSACSTELCPVRSQSGIAASTSVNAMNSACFASIPSRFARTALATGAANECQPKPLESPCPSPATHAGQTGCRHGPLLIGEDVGSAIQNGTNQVASLCNQAQRNQIRHQQSQLTRMPDQSQERDEIFTCPCVIAPLNCDKRVSGQHAPDHAVTVQCRNRSRDHCRIGRLICIRRQPLIPCHVPHQLDIGQDSQYRAGTGAQSHQHCPAHT